MSKDIPLTRGKLATVDDADYESLMRWKWDAFPKRHTWYAKRNEGRFPFHKTVYMHVQIIETPKGMLTDHVDGNGLNNQRSNLRVCTQTENNRHRRKQNNNTSGYKGVYFVERDQAWIAAIRVNGKLIHLKTHPTPEAAARAYDSAARNYHGAFAATNFNEE